MKTANDFFVAFQFLLDEFKEDGVSLPEFEEWVEEAFQEWRIESYPSHIIMADEETDNAILAHMRSVANLGDKG